MPLVSLTAFLNTHFDYVIVGGGTSGIVLATRLSENPDLMVGVIEAGEHHTNVPEVDVPGMMGMSLTNPTYNWGFVSSPQVHADDEVRIQPRGKGLGGSSLINFLGMFRPSEQECNALERLQNPGWNWASLLAYMKKSENTDFPALPAEIAEKYAIQPDKAFHGVDGPLAKSIPQRLSKTVPVLFETVHNLGISRNPDTGKGMTIGTMSSFCSIDPVTRKRTHAASAYFEPNASRSNLKVLTSTQITKMVLEPDQKGVKRVVALELHHNGSTTKFEHFTDVILSAGVFQTPQLLELSGIGDQRRLSDLGINVAVDLPGVGENLQDHVLVTTTAQIDSAIETVDVLYDPEEMKKHQELYHSKEGLLTSIPATSFMFLSAQTFGSIEEVETWKQQIEEAKSMIPRHLHPTVREGIKKQYDIQSDWLTDRMEAEAEILHFDGHQPIPGLVPPIGNRYTSLFPSLMHPLSRGSVHISSKDPFSPPTIDPKYLSVKGDLDKLLSILKYTLKLYKTQPLSDVVKGYVFPPESNIEDDDSLREYIKKSARSCFHPLGTAAMLPREWGGVVDSNLRAYGTSNLRVVDLSIFPIHVTAHIQSLAYAIGEKAADIIKECHQSNGEAITHGK